MTQPYISVGIMLAFVFVYVCAFGMGWIVCSMLRDAKQADKPGGYNECDLCKFGKDCTRDGLIQCYTQGKYSGYVRRETDGD